MDGSPSLYLYSMSLLFEGELHPYLSITKIIISPFLLSFSLCFLLIPIIIYASHKGKMLDLPGGRKIHQVATPRLGGIAIMIALLTSIMLSSSEIFDHQIRYLLPPAVFILLVGIWDDISHISSWLKLAAQVFVAAYIVLFLDIRITTFFGIMGIEELPNLVSYLFSILTIIVIMNSFNLIDGIHGLSASLAILTSLVFGIWFYLVDAFLLSGISFSLTGACVAFIFFNWNPAKIFLGDGGSLITGMLVAILTLEFLHLQDQLAATSIYAMKGVPIVAISILILPLIDTIRVFILRLTGGRSPLHPDRQHIHHKLIDAGYSHSQATSILVVINTIFVLIAFGFHFVGSIYLLLIVVGLLMGCAYYFNQLILRKNRVL